MYVTRRLLRASVEDAHSGSRPLEPESTPTAMAAVSSSVSPRKRRPLAQRQKSNDSISMTPQKTSTKENSGNENGRMQSSGLGLLVDAMDTQNRWCEAKIINVDLSTKSVLIHYVGWNSRYDCWVSAKQLAAHGHHTRVVKKNKLSWNGKTPLFSVDTPHKTEKKEKIEVASDKEIMLRSTTSSSLRKRRQRESADDTRLADKVDIADKEKSKKKTRTSIAANVKVEVSTVDEETDRRSRRRQKQNVDIELELDIHDVPEKTNKKNASPLGTTPKAKVTETKKLPSTAKPTEQTSNKRTRSSTTSATMKNSRPVSTSVSPRSSTTFTNTTTKVKDTKDRSKTKRSPRISAVENETKTKNASSPHSKDENSPAQTQASISLSVTEPVSSMARRSARSTVKSRKAKVQDDADGSDEEFTVDANEEDEEEDEDDEEEEMDSVDEHERPAKRMRGVAMTKSNVQHSTMNSETRQKLAAIFRMRLQQQGNTPRGHHVPRPVVKKSVRRKQKTRDDDDDEEEEEPGEVERNGMSEAEYAIQSYYHQQQQLQAAYQYQQYYYHQAMVAAQHQQADEEQHCNELVAAAAMVEGSGANPEDSMMENGRIIQARMEALEQQRRVHAYYQQHLQARERNLQLLASSQDILEKSGTAWREQLHEKEQETSTEKDDMESERVAEVAKLLVERAAIETAIEKAQASPMEKVSKTKEENMDASPVSSSSNGTKTTNEVVLYEFVL